MTKKHFIELSAILKRHNNLKDAADGERVKSAVSIGLLIGDIADFCQKQNPYFDRSRFVKACGC